MLANPGFGEAQLVRQDDRLAVLLHHLAIDPLLGVQRHREKTKIDHY